MKILRIFGLISLVIYSTLLLIGCGRGTENDSTSNNYLKTIRSLSSSVINTLKGTTTPILNHIKSPSLQEKNLFSFGFRSSKSGTISYSGNCFGSTKNAIKGDHHILLGSMVEGNYAECAIQVTDKEGNASELLQVPSFKVDFSAPELFQVGDIKFQGWNIEMEIKASEKGRLVYNGKCSSDLQYIDQGKSEVSISFPGEGLYSDCKLTLIDSSGNTSVPLSLGTVRIDATPPVLAEIKPVHENIHTNRPSYSFKTSKSGTLNFSGKCRGNVDKAVVGINHIALLTAEPGIYDDCTMTLTDSSNNISLPLKISSFVIFNN
jgi:hypothetical protein